MVEKEKIMEDLMKEGSIYKDRTHLVSTKDYDLTLPPSGGNSARDRSDWADKIVNELYNKERKDIIKKEKGFDKGEVNFAYIKFMKNRKGEIFGAISGLSSFHKGYPSDVWFYDVEHSHKNKVKDMKRNFDLDSWYTEEIIIITSGNRKEAREDEKSLKEMFYLES